jgi:hypothetical protein
MELKDVLHALVNQLPADWDLAAAHEAVDAHYDGGQKQPAAESKAKGTSA